MRMRRKVIALRLALTFVVTLAGCGGGGGGGTIPPKVSCATLTADQEVQVANYVEQARSLLFQSSVSKAEFDSAKLDIDNALTIDSCNPDANLLGAAIDIGSEAERISENVLFTPDTIFPIGGYSVAKNLLSRSIEPVSNTFLGPISHSKPFGSFKTRSKTREKFTSDNPPPSEIQQEVEKNVLPVIDGIIAKLELVKDYTDSSPTWTFSYPKDPANPSLGNNSIDKSDVKGLVGAVKLLRGLTYLGLAYDWDTPSGWDWNDDPNGDGISTPDEYFPPDPFGKLRTNGSTYLSSAKSDISSGLSTISTALDEILQETNPTAGGSSLIKETINDLNHYKHYINELAASFGGTATAITLPATKQCWNKTGWGWYSTEYIFDPTYNTGQTCEFSVTEQAEKTITVNFSALLGPSDWQSLAPTKVKEAISNWWLVQSFPDETFNGLFPSKIQTSWFDFATADRFFSFSIKDSSATTAGCDAINASGTLKIGSVTFTPSGCSKTDYLWDSGTSSFTTGYQIDFYSNNTLTLPTTADVYTYNALYGTQATLTLPGYNPITLLIHDLRSRSSFVGGGIITPTPI